MELRAAFGAFSFKQGNFNGANIQARVVVVFGATLTFDL